MKAPSFAYAKPATLAEVFDLLERHGDGAKLLAGGQSLIPSLNMRLSSPSVLVDITGIPGLGGIKVDGDTVRIGALTTHADLERSPEIASKLPLLAQAVKQVAHVAIREDLVQTLISAADLDRMVRSLGPDQQAAAEQATQLVARALHILEHALAQGQAAARRDQRQAAYAASAR